MRSICSFAFIAASSFALPTKVSVDALIGYDPLLLDPSPEGLQPRFSYGIAVGPNITWKFNPRISLDVGVRGLYDQENLSGPYQESPPSPESSLRKTTERWRIGLKMMPEVQVTENLRVGAGYEWDIPVAGTQFLTSPTVLNGARRNLNWDLGSIGSSDIPVASVHNFLADISWSIQPSLEIVLQGKYGLNKSLSESYGKDPEQLDPGTSNPNEFNARDHQIAIGIRYRFD